MTNMSNNGMYLQEELGAGLSMESFCEYWWCSRAWLEGQAEQPNQGYTPEELQVG